ncbi:MAG: lysylphosphatidylglycerol synthase transmembrane domain-containing protein [Gemmatimonadota bacterium]|mgnify:FL=1
MSPRRWVLVALSFLAALALSIDVVWNGWRSTGSFPSLPWRAHVLALLVFVLETLARATKVQWGAKALRIPLRWIVALRVSLGGDFGASVTPARAGAEPARFLVLAEAGVATAPALLILFFEIALELVSLVIVCSLLAFFTNSGALAGGMIGVIGGYALFVIGLAGGAFVIAGRRANGPPPEWMRALGIHAGRWRAIQRALRHIRSGMTGLRRARPGAMLVAFMLSLTHVALRLAVLPALVYGAGARTPLAPLIIWPLLLLYGGAIAPAPGGGGAIEFGFSLGLKKVLDPSMFAAALIWWRVYSFYLYLLAGAIVAGTTVLRAINNSNKPPAPVP